MITQRASNPGHLSCDECNTLWCNHIERYVRNMEDAEDVWADYPDDCEIMIPIVPTSNVWARGILTSRADAIQSYGLSLEVQQKDPYGTSAEFIGFVNPGEGRIVFREMVLDWFVAHHADDGKECIAPGHGYHEQVRWNRDMDDPMLKLRQQWTLFMTGKCLGCTYDSSSNDQFVPDVATNSPWNPYS